MSSKVKISVTADNNVQIGPEDTVQVQIDVKALRWVLLGLLVFWCVVAGLIWWLL